MTDYLKFLSFQSFILLTKKHEAPVRILLPAGGVQQFLQSLLEFYNLKVQLNGSDLLPFFYKQGTVCTGFSSRYQELQTTFTAFYLKGHLETKNI